ncbi:MAG: tetratricopeptide repeat protein [Candidatus Binatia bacterium]|nr:tetratricopeptide repeat protein [Candidatus Binatia bacterium]
MLRRIAIILLVLLVGGGVAVLFHFNGHPTTVHVGEKSSIELPTAAHLLIALSLGAGLVVFAGLLRSISGSFGRWRERRRQKKAAAVDKIRQEGRHRLWAGDFHSAGKKLARAAEKEPQDLETHLALARSQQELGELEAAQKILEAARAQHGPHPRLLSRLGNLAMARGNSGAAIDAFREAAATQPESPRLLAELMAALAAEGHYEDAVDAARRRLTLERHSIRREQAKRDWLGVRYRAAVAQNDPKKANEELKRLASEEPTFLPPLMELAARARADGDVRGADRLYRDSLRRQPSGAVLDRFQSLHTGAGEPARALGPLRDASGKTALPGPRLLLARTLVAAGKLEAAEEALADLSRESTAKGRAGADIAAERDLVSGELALSRGNDREAAKLLLRAATARRTPFSYACQSCGRTNREWIPSCECGAYGTYDWSVNGAEQEAVKGREPS